MSMQDEFLEIQSWRRLHIMRAFSNVSFFMVEQVIQYNMLCAYISTYIVIVRFILNPIKKYGVSDEKGQESMRILKCVLQRIMLRRTKLDKAGEKFYINLCVYNIRLIVDDLCLPPRNIYIRNDYLNAEENDFYESLYSQSKTKFMGYVEEGTILNNYAHVFDLLLRLRQANYQTFNSHANHFILQAVDHPLLVLYAKDKAGGKEVHDWCSICFEPAEGPVRSKCKHAFCRGCIENYLGNSEGEKKVCPECKRQLTINLSDSNDGGKENSTKYTSIMQSVDPGDLQPKKSLY
jgi:DNA repair protein RAD16